MRPSPTNLAFLPLLPVATRGWMSHPSRYPRIEKRQHSRLVPANAALFRLEKARSSGWYPLDLSVSPPFPGRFDAWSVTRTR